MLLPPATPLASRPIPPLHFRPPSILLLSFLPHPPHRSLPFPPRLRRPPSQVLLRLRSWNIAQRNIPIAGNLCVGPSLPSAPCGDEGTCKSCGLQLGQALLRGFLLAIACTSCLMSKQLAYAAAMASDSSFLHVPALLQQSKSGLASIWPKLVQVMGVFRDHGLMLSILLGLSAFFSMAETSITTLWPWKVRELAEKETGGGVFHMLKQDVTRFLTTILIGTTVTNIAATALVTDAATALFGEAGVSAATGVMTVVILLLTEITPKSIAVHNATEVARIVVRPVAWLSYILYPVGRIVTAISMGLLKFFGVKSSGEPFVTEEELKLMLRGAELSGAIEEEEQDMIENVLEIKDTYVREVMTPLVDVVAIDASATVMDFRNLWVTHQYSRVPVFERRVDNIVGIAYAMDMLDYVEQVEVLQRMTVGRIAHKPAYFVPDSMSVWNLLREFRIRKVHMAIVLNEYGGTVGIVTLEDVVEEIVGEIFDENDSKEEIRRKTGYIIQRADGVFDVDANTSIEDLTEALEVEIPEGPYHYETVSGFVCEAFGYIPRTGESIRVILKNSEDEDSDLRDSDVENQEDQKEKFQTYRLEILAGNARKVGSVRFERLYEPEKNLAKGQEAKSSWHWEEKEVSEYETVDMEDGENQQWDSESEANRNVQQPDDDHEDNCDNSNIIAKNRYLIADSIDVDNLSDSDSGCVDEEYELNNKLDELDTCNVESNDMDISTATAVDTLYKKWEKRQESGEKQKQLRRKSFEPTVKLDKHGRFEHDRHRKFYFKRKETDTGIRISRKPDSDV